jgi:DNA-binding winged helix-turn-helix (wHTH) protein
MDQVLTKRLQFEHFALDLARGTLRMGEREIDLRPKTFDVLRCLAENAGRLVSKQELYEAVWPDVTVSDDALVQCIRELRLALGDEKHSLIKTVPRRGYLLDVERRTPGPLPSPEQHPISNESIALDPPRRIVTPWGLRVGRAGPWRMAAGAAVLLCLGLAVLLLEVLAGHHAPSYSVSLDFKPARLPPSALNKLFSESDAQRVAAIAQSKQLPLPPIEFDTPDRDVPLAIRRFVGIWVSTKGFVNTNRQFMLIVTHVEKTGLVGGYTVRGPPAPNSRIQNPAEAIPFTAFISDNVLTYANPRGDYKVWFVEQDGLVFRQTYVTGDMTMVALEPIWSLTKAEHAQQSLER